MKALIVGLIMGCNIFRFCGSFFFSLFFCEYSLFAFMLLYATSIVVHDVKLHCALIHMQK